MLIHSNKSHSKNFTHYLIGYCCILASYYTYAFNFIRFYNTHHLLCTILFHANKPTMLALLWKAYFWLLLTPFLLIIFINFYLALILQNQILKSFIDVICLMYVLISL